MANFSPNTTESNQQSFFPHRTYCFCIPYRWHKVPSSEHDEQQQEHESNQTLWSRGVAALKKIREWSEIVAGPKWKTFIRRFNHGKTIDRHSSKYQYDPLSYELNFDHGPVQNGDPDTENEYLVRNFSSRYALPVTSIPVTGKTMIDNVRKHEIGLSFV
ncbi:uncharacterized protein [Rutidosis leptorrhynchoides]|uniref:uncharacterized protein n=1 Tax=Rutidosis leptorrhynchoides TaxID=125765 RepID=UPI003A9A3C02